MWIVTSSADEQGLMYFVINTTTNKFYIKSCGRCRWSSRDRQEADKVCFDLNRSV